ncbi:class I SAM-dependent DNA methyltransferase [Actinopolymorpha sp. NPDC004070]|uniref:class I SAM-dependent DNA methyltransferase n=1 Tax=Actinopolymorpha sp. NPDC004070 TaxID=3154548 RepID=UPI0033A1CFE0
MPAFSRCLPFGVLSRASYLYGRLGGSSLVPACAHLDAVMCDSRTKEDHQDGVCAMVGDGQQGLADSIWSVTDLLRGNIRTTEFGSVILPFTVLRRMDCLRGQGGAPESSEGRRAGCPEGAAADAGLVRLLPGPESHAVRGEQSLAADLYRLAQECPAGLVDLLDSFHFAETVHSLAKAHLLGRVVSHFAALDLSHATVPVPQMGQAFEELLRRLTETLDVLWEHTTPRDVTSITARLVLGPDIAELSRTHRQVRVYDPCCGTGGMFSAAETLLRGERTRSELVVAGQEVNAQAYAVACSLLLMKGMEPGGLSRGDVLVDDRYSSETFHYLMAAPPFGVSWKRQQEVVTREARDLAFAGRFGAGLPSLSDGSLLFVQHVVSHMRSAEQGGARAAILLNASPLNRGGAGSGESEIRRWLLEQDILEGVIALPAQLWPNTAIPTYILVLSNRKPSRLRGKVIALDAGGQCATRRKFVGSKRKYLTDQHISDIVQRYERAREGELSEERSVDGEHSALLFDADDFGYREVRVDHPMRQHFEVNADVIDALESAKLVSRFEGADHLLRALRSLSGQTWATWSSFTMALASALEGSDLSGDLTPTLWRLLRRTAGALDPLGEVQRDEQGRIIPDPALRDRWRVPLRQDLEDSLQRDLTELYPDSQADLGSIEIGYSLPQAPFINSWPSTGFGPLSRVARQVPNRSLTQRDKEGKRLLRGHDLQAVATAADLPEATESELPLAACIDGDVVGQHVSWRLLPGGFGDALTPLTVLRPIGDFGFALCEWLQRGSEEGAGVRRLSPHTLVPLTLIKDVAVNGWLEELYAGRAALAAATSQVLPNVFSNPRAGVNDIRRTARAAASDGRIIGELMSPLEDPVWRAEWSYPYQVAASARQYRTATQLGQRQDALLKLGESVARCVGVLSVAVLIQRGGGLTRALRDPFTRGDGATFGVWHRRVTDLLKAGSVPELPEIENILDDAGGLGPLSRLLAMRNYSRHASRVQPDHELEREVETLESEVVATLEAVGWLSGLHWDLVDACSYVGNGSFAIRGRRLRGSHPEWEAFEDPSAGVVEPNRIYVRGSSSLQSLDLWPIARVEVCAECGSRELFLLHKSEEKEKLITLRCARDHEIKRPIN